MAHKNGIYLQSLTLHLSTHQSCEEKDCASTIAFLDSEQTSLVVHGHRTCINNCV